MFMSEETLTREILQRLTKIEENTKGINEVADKADGALALAVSNEKQINDIKANNKWSWGFIISLGLTIIGYFFTNILGGK